MMIIQTQDAYVISVLIGCFFLKVLARKQSEPQLKDRVVHSPDFEPMKLKVSCMDAMKFEKF